MSNTSNLHNKLFRLYEHYVGEPDSKKDVYGYWLFVLGFVVGAVAVALYVVNFEATQAQSSAEFFVNRIVGVIGSLGVTVMLFGLVLMLPVRRRAIQASVVGLCIAIAGAVTFGLVYPENWRGIGGGPDYTLTVIGLFSVGIGIIAGVTALVPVVTGRKGKYVSEEGATENPEVLTGDALEGAQFAVFRDEQGDWRWHVLHLEALAMSQDSALTRPDAEEDIDIVKSQIGSAGLMELTTAAFRLYQTRDGQWRWTLVREDGSVVARCGEEHANRDGAEESVSLLKDQGPNADVIEIDDAAFNYYQERDRWHWQLIDDDRRSLATGPTGYESKADAEDGATAFAERVGDARLLAVEYVAVELLERGSGWSWRFVDTDDEELAESTIEYDSRRDAEDAVEALLEKLEDASVTVAGEPTYELYESGEDWRWRLVDGNERVIARNPEDVTTFDGVEDGTERFAENALDADVFEIDGATYETYPVDDHWRWRLVTDDREIVASSTEPHETADDAAQAIERMREQANEADLIEFEQSAFQVYEADSGEWRWRLIDEDGNVLADSGAEHDSKGEAAEAMMTLKEQAPDAELLEIDTAAFELFVDDGDWGWRLIDEGGKLVAEDPAVHPNRKAAREAMDRLVTHLGAEIRTMDSAAFQSYVRDDDWHWRFVLPSGDVVANGEDDYPTRNELEESLGRVREAAASAATHTIGEVAFQVHGNGSWRWRLLDRDREVIVESNVSYDGREAVVDAVDELTDHAVDAPIFQIEEALVRLTNGDGWGWELVDPDREVLATAGTTERSSDEAIEVVDDVRRLAPLAGRVDFDVASFELVSVEDGWQWRLIDESGSIVAESVETFDTNDAVSDALENVRDQITAASILEIDGVSFELNVGEDGWIWRLVDEHGEAMSESTQSYANRTDAREAMNSVKVHAPDGWITFTE